MKKSYNTYISVTICIHNNPTYNSGRIYSSVENCKLDLHLDVSYKTAKQELAKLMLRTGRMPNKRVYDDMVFYSLDAFLD